MGQNEKTLWFCTLLDCGRHVYHDAASQSALGSSTDHFVSHCRLQAVLLLTYLMSENRKRTPEKESVTKKAPLIIWFDDFAALSIPCHLFFLITHALHVRISDRMYIHTSFWNRLLFSL